MKLLITALLFVIPMSITAQDTIIPLWPKNQIPNRIASDEKEVHVKEGILRISKVQEPHLEIYLPAKQMQRDRQC